MIADQAVPMYLTIYLQEAFSSHFDSCCRRTQTGPSSGGQLAVRRDHGTETYGMTIVTAKECKATNGKGIKL